MKIQVLGPIDKGGFGNVDLVENEAGERFARKCFSQNQPLSEELLENVRKRFVKEVRIQGAISHRNIVPIVSSDLDGEPPSYLMPLAAQSLARDLAGDRQLGGNFVTAISDIVAGLEVLHAMQIFHRDLKPQNVLRFNGAKGSDDHDFYAISDFGLISLKESQLSALTSTGMARGSDFYTAPEITKDLRHASARSDIYSLGCILHDMVGTEVRIPCAEIREGGPFSAILLGCTKKNPEQRFKSAKAVLDAILCIDLSAHTQPTQKSIDFIAILDAAAPPPSQVWEDLAEFLENEATPEDSRAIFLKLSADRIDALCLASLASANRIAILFSAWVFSSSFNFEYCDGLANRLELFIANCDFEAKVDCIMALLEMGTTHNRWYVEHKFVGMCGPAMEPNLANRLGVQFRIADTQVCRRIAHLERSIDFNRASLHPVLVRALSEICK